MKRLLSVLLICMMALLASCAGNSGEVPTSKSEETSSSQAASQAVESAASEAEKTYYTVTYDGVDGKDLYTQSVAAGERITPPQINRAGMTVEGWYNGVKKWDLENDKVSGDVKLTAKYTLNDDIFDVNKNAGTRAKGANLRIMSFNLLADDWNNKPAVPGRDEKAFDAIKRYSPDVVGVQECNAVWYYLCEKNFPEYAFVNSGNNKVGSNVNYSTLLYNTDKVTLTEFGQSAYSNNSNNRFTLNMTWGLFEQKADGKKYIAISTHWGLTAEIRMVQAKELAAKIAELKTKYNVPVFAMGDFNAGDSTEEFNSFLKESEFADSKRIAETQGVICQTFHRGDGTGTKEDYNSGYWKLGTASFRTNMDTFSSIDHIVCASDAKVLYYNTITEADVLDASDHCPIYADFVI